MNVLADLHHGDLYYSLKLLFENRLGWNLYRPIGLDWFDAGYFQIAAPYGNARDTINQFLALDTAGFNQYESLNGDHDFVSDGTYNVKEPIHDYYQKAITFAKFKEMKFDLVVASHPLHDVSWEEMTKKHQPQAKFIVQIGNIYQRTNSKNVMYTMPFQPQAHQNTVYYHQELDMTRYKAIPPNPATRNIYSVLNLLPYPELYNRYKNNMLDCEFKAYGAGAPDGALFGCKEVGVKMQEANLGYHIKPMNGFGHSAMGWAASGRCQVTSFSQLVEKSPDTMRFFQDGVTCINLDGYTFEDDCKLIREALEPEKAMWYYENVTRVFNDVFNYERDEQLIREFLGKLL